MFSSETCLLLWISSTFSALNCFYFFAEFVFYLLIIDKMVQTIFWTKSVILMMRLLQMQKHLRWRQTPVLEGMEHMHTSKKRKSLRSLLPSPKYFTKKCVNLDNKISWNEAKIYKKVGLLTTFLCNVGESETKNMFIRHLWHFFTTLWHIYKAIALPGKIQQCKLVFTFSD